jgi:hypothetical protein
VINSHPSPTLFVPLHTYALFLNFDGAAKQEGAGLARWNSQKKGGVGKDGSKGLWGVH